MDLADAITRVRPSTVQISLDGKTVMGTGFVVADTHHILTALHVIEGCEPGRIFVSFAVPDTDTPELIVRAGFVVCPATVVATSDPDDLALLEVTPPTETGMRVNGGRAILPVKPITISDRKVRDGTPIAISGYPLSHPSLVTTSGHIASAWSSADTTATSIEGWHLGDVTANPGNSGGPCYSISDGALVGMLHGVRLTNVYEGGAPLTAQALAGLAIIVPRTRIQALLDRHFSAEHMPDVPPPTSNRQGSLRRR